MVEVMDVKGATEALAVGVTTTAAPAGMAQLTAVLREKVNSLPGGGALEIRVLTATLEPGDRTPRHVHRFPVTLYMHQGTFTLELDGRTPVRIAAGEAFVEPAGVPMTGRNEGSEIAHMSLFYVCEPGVPFADPL